MRLYNLYTQHSIFITYYLCASKFHTIVHFILLVSRCCMYIYGIQHNTCINPLCSVPPVLNLFPFADRDVVEGENLVASCRASGNPTPIIQWFRDNQLLSGSQSISISQRSNGISQLTVIGFANENVGMYSCVAVNNLGSDSKSFQVNAVGKLA